MKQKLKSGDEFDAVCHRTLFHWRPGQTKRIKRSLNKRNRQSGKREIEQQPLSDTPGRSPR